MIQFFPFLCRRREPDPPAPSMHDTLRARGWIVAGSSVGDRFVVTIRKDDVVASFKAPSEERALAEAARYAASFGMTRDE